MRRVAMLCPRPGFHTVPSIKAGIDLLVEAGYSVDVVTDFHDDRFTRPEGGWRGVEFLLLEPRSQSSAVPKWGWLQAKYHRLNLRTTLLRREYALVFAVDPEGLVLLQRLRGWLRAPFIYWSLELLVSSELTSETDRYLKEVERSLSGEASLVISQDPERAAVLIAENGLDPKRIAHVPNSPLPVPLGPKSDRLKQLFSLPARARIVLQAGAVLALSGAHRLALSTRSWPQDWYLVIHSSHKREPVSDEYTAVLQDLAAPGKLFLSRDPVPENELHDLMRSADVGVALYLPRPGSRITLGNLQHRGLSSGKISHYLRAGLPVLVNDLPALQKLVTTYNCGKVVRDADDIVPALERILGDHESYVLAARQCFDEHLDVRRSFEIVLSHIKERASRPGH